MQKTTSQFPIILKRDCFAIRIPSGEKITLTQGSSVVMTQSLGGNFTVCTDEFGLARVGAPDADALGFNVLQAPETLIKEIAFSRQTVIEKLKAVFDPEIPVNVVDLGLIYSCEAYPQEGGGHRIEIKMSMTAPGCGMGDILKKDAESVVKKVSGVTEVNVEIVWDPPWDRNRMSEAARLQLGML
jgi:probable FeS assembly SUF system protein SufT